MTTERAVYYRERASKFYKSKAYTFAVGIVELPYLVVSCTIFSAVFYSIVGFQSNLICFLNFWFFMFQWMSLTTFMGQFLTCALPDQQTAQIAGILSMNISNTFAGFLQGPSDIPSAFQFFYWISPFHYVFEGILVTQFKGDTTPITLTNPTSGFDFQVTMEQFLYMRFDAFDYEHRYTSYIVLIGFVLFFRIGTLYALTYINHLVR